MSIDYFFEYYLKNIKDLDKIKSDRVKIINKLKIKNIEKINTSIIKKIFDIIDKYLFKDTIKEKINNMGYDLDFDTSNRFKNIAGSFSVHKNILVITFSKKILDNLFIDNVTKIEINGINCYNLLETLVLLMEHEMTHMIIYLLKDHHMNIGEEKSGHTITFKKFTNNLFGHTKISHSLRLGDIDDHHKKNKESKDILKIGNKIRCKKYEGVLVDIKDSIGIFKIGDYDFRSCFLKDIEKINNNILNEKIFMKKIKIGYKLHMKIRGKYMNVEIIGINNKTIRVKEVDTEKKWNLSIWYLR